MNDGNFLFNSNTQFKNKTKTAALTVTVLLVTVTVLGGILLKKKKIIVERVRTW